MNILSINNLTLQTEDKKILNNLSLDIWEGSIHAIVGHNGAGKSTLASAIMGLSGYENIEGDILFKGKSIKDLTIFQRADLGITLGWQEPARYEGLKVRDFVSIPSKNKEPEYINSLFVKMGMNPEEYLERGIDKTLSGGERKKIELISILAMEPKLVILDEPDSGIDIASITKIFEAIQILKKKGTTVILITHSEAVLRHAEHVFIMCCGQIIDKGTPKDTIPFWNKKCADCLHKNEPGKDV
ncbi:MAG: ABC transporter ATP-binding protein [Spirochaetes bacterium]|nr:ABC transporter ATP-binding protein [Spirochaetota bacterium]